MEDRGLRDIERWRDKIEVRLDNRQVFFLFFGSALVACMLFVLGVIVGKRLESRGRAVSPEIEDPLALLDKVATTPRTPQTGVTFPQALFGNGKTAGADKHGKKNLLPAPAAMPAPVAPEKPEPSKAVAVLETPKPAPAAKPVVAAAAAEDKPVATKPEPKAEPKAAEPAAEPKVAPAKAKVAETKEIKPAPAAKPASIPTVVAGDSKGKGRFTLQLSSFQDKSEAEAFAQKFEGERPYLVASEIPGKGTWYRVRVGDFASSKDAVAGKASFEKKHNVIAYVAQK
jgi:septal ring-binding cell division protein DamX